MGDKHRFLYSFSEKNLWHILQLWARAAQTDPLALLPPHRLDLHLPLPRTEDHIGNLSGSWWLLVFYGYWCVYGYQCFFYGSWWFLWLYVFIWLLVVCCGYRCLSMVINVFLLICNTSPSVEDHLCHLYQETIAGRVCTLQTLSLVNEVSRKTLIGAQWYTHIANVFNLYWSHKVHSFRKLNILPFGQQCCDPRCGSTWEEYVPTSKWPPWAGTSKNWSPSDGPISLPIPVLNLHSAQCAAQSPKPFRSLVAGIPWTGTGGTWSHWKRTCATSFNLTLIRL